MDQEQLIEKLLSRQSLSRHEKDQLRGLFPEERLEALILQSSRKKMKQNLIRRLFKIQNLLYPEKKKKKFKVVPTVEGHVVHTVVSGGLPGLGKK